MKCQICHDKDAVMHVKQVLNGHAREMHLCQECAAKNGLDVQSPMGIADLLFGIEVHQNPAKQRSSSCRVCGLKRSDFQKNTRLGCATCYDTFNDDLVPMLADMQKDLKHIGKMPSHAVVGIELNRMEAELKRAIETEDYERAASLRDKINEARNKSRRQDRV